MPAIFVPHGGGPWPFMDLERYGMAGGYDALETYLRGLSISLPRRPSALLVVSAHWEAPVPTVMTSTNPPMLYDYSGFPPETYELSWPAPGAPEVAERTRELLEGAGISSASDDARGFDHGTFVPLMLAWEHADVPTFQLSLQRGLDPRRHLAIGRALAPLRDDDVLIIGSGMSYHNMGGFFGRVPDAAAHSDAFDAWLTATVDAEADARDTRLAEWDRAPAGRLCHPREEHLLPLMVVAGAGGDDHGTVPYSGRLGDVRVSAAQFG
ncbi:MAG: dioxygenase [Myxococcales bacterium]|nr:dioxygenase [Myxococcales bacterium]